MTVNNSSFTEYSSVNYTKCLTKEFAKLIDSIWFEN